MANKIQIALIVLAVVIVLLAVVYGTEKPKPIEWSTMKYVCSGYGTKDNPAGFRCTKVARPNIADDIRRQHYYCEEHYNQIAGIYVAFH